MNSVQVEKFDLTSDSNSGQEMQARATITAQLAELSRMAIDPNTLGMSIGVVVRQLDNHLEYRNVNGEFNGSRSQADVFNLGWRHTVSDQVSTTFQRLADQMIPSHTAGEPYTEVLLGNDTINFNIVDRSADCMCDDPQTEEDED